MVNSMMTVRCPGPVAAKEAQIITSPPLCLMVGIRWTRNSSFVSRSLVVSSDSTLQT